MPNKELIHNILYKYWGYTKFRELQEEIILSILEGRDTLGLMPTGGGKSITFQVPTMALDGLALVITPIISLMKDQVDNLKDRGIKATYLHAGLTSTEQKKVIEKCTNGNYKFLYISPERLQSEKFINLLKLIKVSLIVVDEAHCISQWGYDFRPSFLNISKVRKIKPNIPILALTATATKTVAKDIMDKLGFINGQKFAKSFVRENLSYVVQYTEEKISKLIHILNSVNGTGIVYVRSRKRTKQISDELNYWGIPADFYHAGLTTEEKDDKQNKWKSGELRVIVATNAFGMGIDKPDVRIVVHIDIPNSIEEYYQEAGRAGRDGKKSYVVLLVSKIDKANLKKRLNDSFPKKDFIKTVYELLGDFLGVSVGYGYSEIFEFNLAIFCKNMELPAIQTHNALKILSRSGYIEYIDEIDTQSRVTILANKDELYNISSAQKPHLDKVLQAILRTYSGLFSDYVFINEQLISYKTGISQEDVYDSLLVLTKMRILHYIPRKRTPYIIYTTSRENKKDVLIPRHAYDDLKSRLDDRINAIIDYAYNDTSCRESFLVQYFGEDLTIQCGHCDICIEKKKEKRYSHKDIQNGILYMTSLKPRTIEELTDTLSFPKKEIIEMTSFLVDEGFIFHTSDNKYSNPKKLK